MQIATRALPGVAVRASKSSPAMPDPDPQPPKPRPVSPARWLLMLLPSVIVMATPLCSSLVFINRKAGEPNYMMLLWFPAIAAMLCFVLGFQLEKWRRGTLAEPERAIGFGFLILILNTIASYGGCNVIFHK